ncbi:MAG: DUF885 domain-containing protein [Acidimicrobiia bacterium]|nr:DUF885 domain-containing protein [Acidimicrobiia bacterium]MDH4308350.1 DUF885 domain-containing protein [Acidimicrobiia bacterium]
MPTSHTSPRSLADEFVSFRRASDHEHALWAGELEYLERWPEIGGTVADTYRDLARRASELATATPTDQILVDTIEFSGESMATQLEWRPELKWMNPAAGFLPSVFTFLPRYVLTDPDHGPRYLEKVTGLAAFLDGWGDRLADAASAGVVPIEHLVSGVVAMLDKHLARPLSEGPLAAQSPPPGAGPDWNDELGRILDGTVAPAFDRLRTTLRSHSLPNAQDDARPGLLHLDGGCDLYERLVWAHTSMHVTAQQVHETGLAQIERLEDEYRELGRSVLGTRDIGEIYARLRDDPGLHYQDAETLVADAERALAKAAGAAERWFGVLPQAPCNANAIDQGPLAFYSRPAPDGSKPGRFFFNTSDPSMWGTFQLEAVTYHEGIPGHHLQLSIAQENPGLHRLLSDYYIAAYNEGWGLYTERLAEEMGLYSSDLDRFGMLSADSMRACRLVVDTGIHALGWTRSQAIQYIVDHSPMTRDQIAGEIDRYIGDPGQALGYMIGRLEIDAMRARAESTLGDRFDIKAFHDCILGTGSVPISTMHRVVDAWIAET